MTDISKPGVHEIPPNDRVGAANRFAELHRLGHAITLDYIYNDEKKLALLRVHHYRTCTACSGDKHGLTSV